MSDLIYNGAVDDENKPKIEFPCQYPIKVIGVANDSFQSTVFEIVSAYVPELKPECMTTKASGKGTFVSITFNFVAQSEEQVMTIFEALKACSDVKMVL